LGLSFFGVSAGEKPRGIAGSREEQSIRTLTVSAGLPFATTLRALASYIAFCAKKGCPLGHPFFACRWVRNREVSRVRARSKAAIRYTCHTERSNLLRSRVYLFINLYRTS